MKTELRATPHSRIPGATVIEIWYDGQFIGQITGADGPGIRVFSKHGLNATHTVGDGTASDPDVVTVTVTNDGWRK